MSIRVTQEMIDAFMGARFTDAQITDEQIGIGIVQAVLDMIDPPTFVITDEVVEAAAEAALLGITESTKAVRAAATAAGFRVVEQ